MTRITIEVEFEVADVWCANSVDQEEKKWFWDKVIPSCTVGLHSNEVGDIVAETNSFTIKEITFNTKEK